MFYQLFPRTSLETGETLTSPAVSAEDISVLVASLTAYQVSGTSPSLQVMIQTSDDGEVWASVGAILTSTANGLTFGNFVVTTNEWGRLVRAVITISGTGAVFEFALGLHTHQSS